MKHTLDNYPRSFWETLIDEWIFNERDRKIIKRRLLDGLTFDELADEFNLSPQHIKKIVYKAINKISKFI